jgi:hypothetical protein
MAMLINHVFIYVGFSTKACHRFGRPQTWEVNIYICVGTSLIGWLDGKYTLPHGFSVQNTPIFQYGHVLQCKIMWQSKLMIDSPNKTCSHINIFFQVQCSRPFKRVADLGKEVNNPKHMVELPDILLTRHIWLFKIMWHSELMIDLPNETCSHINIYV